MSKLSRILLIERATPPQSLAWHRAIMLARRSGAELRVCLLIDETTHRSAAVAPDVAAESLQRVRKALRGEGLRVETEVIRSTAPHEAVIAKAIEHNPDLVIAGIEQRRDPLGLYVISGSTWKLARLCPAPLMLVRDWSPLLPTQLTAAVDVTEHLADALLNEEVVRIARIVAAAAGAPVDLLHVFPQRKTVGGRGQPQEHPKDLQQLRQLAEDAAIPAERCHWLEGDVRGKLHDYATLQDGEMLVLGSVYHGAFSRLFLGSNTEAVIASCPCDVLVVKPPGFLRELAQHRDLNALCETYGVAATALLDLS